MMRETFEMESANVKLWMEGKRTYLWIDGKVEELSAYEVEDLIDALVLLRPKRQDANSGKAEVKE